MGIPRLRRWEVQKDRQKEFHQATTILNAWYACLIDKRNSTGEKTGVNLDNKLPKNFLQFSLQLISANYDSDRTFLLLVIRSLIVLELKAYSLDLKTI